MNTIKFYFMKVELKGYIFLHKIAMFFDQTFKHILP